MRKSKEKHNFSVTFTKVYFQQLSSQISEKAGWKKKLFELFSYTNTDL